jgi:hypothetical protein
MATAASRGLCHHPFSWLIWMQGWLTDAVPFFELIRSDISRSRARLGSKFWGSTAFSKDKRWAILASVPVGIPIFTYVYIVAGAFAKVPQSPQIGLLKHNVPTLPPSPRAAVTAAWNRTLLALAPNKMASDFREMQSLYVWGGSSMLWQQQFTIDYGVRYLLLPNCRLA